MARRSLSDTPQGNKTQLICMKCIIFRTFRMVARSETPIPVARVRHGRNVRFSFLLPWPGWSGPRHIFSFLRFDIYFHSVLLWFSWRAFVPRWTRQAADKHKKWKIDCNRGRWMGTLERKFNSDGRIVTFREHLLVVPSAHVPVAWRRAGKYSLPWAMRAVHENQCDKIPSHHRVSCHPLASAWLA